MVTLRHLPHNCGAEVEVPSILDARPMDLPAGKAWFAAVRQIAPDERLRLFLQGPRDATDDIDEATAEELWKGTWAALGLEGVEQQIELRVSP